MENEFLVSPKHFHLSSFGGRILADCPVFMARDPDGRKNLAKAVEYLSGNGWSKIKFNPEKPLESEVENSRRAHSKLKEFSIWISI